MPSIISLYTSSWYRRLLSWLRESQLWVRLLQSHCYLYPAFESYKNGLQQFLTGAKYEKDVALLSDIIELKRANFRNISGCLLERTLS